MVRPQIPPLPGQPVDVTQRYPPIADYGLLSECHSAALVSRSGSIDWACMPRIDSASIFGRLLDWERGGYCALTPTEPFSSERNYRADTMVLETTFHTQSGRARVVDCFTMHHEGGRHPHHQLLRIVEGLEGVVELAARVQPRFDYGDVRPWFRQINPGRFLAVGGDDGLVIDSDIEFTLEDLHDLVGTVVAREGSIWRLSLTYAAPELLDGTGPPPLAAPVLDSRLRETQEWWQHWAQKSVAGGEWAQSTMRSALVLKALTNAPTGAIAAAATTSLPESPGGSRNWDYRLTWIRDSWMTVRALGDVGFVAEAEGFRRFVERSAAGSAQDLQILYGVGGERRVPELELELEGWRGAHPVRVGNGAAKQLQLDVYGYLLELAWRWHQRGHAPDADYWRFLAELVDATVSRWQEPDRGIWEVRGDPQHFVQSKVMCWAALQRGVQLAEDLGHTRRVGDWKEARDACRKAIETQGYDSTRGVFVRSFGSSEMDASLLLLPSVDFVAYDDERMVRTVTAVQSALERGGLLLRYEGEDGLEGGEGVFLACTFWLVDCLARQGRVQEARTTFERVQGKANDLGLFSEEYDVHADEMLGNFPQGLTHLAHIQAACALRDAAGAATSAAPSSPQSRNG